MAGIDKGEILRTFTLNEAEHSFFNEIMTILITSASFTTAADFIRNKSHSQFLKYAEESVITGADFPFAAKNRNEVYSYKFYGLLHGIINKQEISSMTFEVYGKPFQDITNVPNTTLIRHSDSFNFINNVLFATYVKYYEKIKGTIIARYGKDPKTWPEELQFARIVRNAFAHDGKIDLWDPQSQSVSFDGITYSFSDNGKDILDDIWVVEVIDLMIVIDNYIQQIK